MPVFDLGRSFGKVLFIKSLEKVLKKSRNLHSKSRRNPGTSVTMCDNGHIALTSARGRAEEIGVAALQW